MTGFILLNDLLFIYVGVDIALRARAHGRQKRVSGPLELE